MRSLKKVVLLAVFAISLFAMAGTAWADDGSSAPDTGVSWEGGDLSLP
jgi:hypothetical protein